MSVSPFDAYRLYTAVKLHMTTDQYDFVKYCGKVRSVTPTGFDKRNDKWSFVKLAKMFNREEDLILFLACSHIKYSPYIRDLVNLPEYLDCYREHLKVRESLDYTVGQDLRFLLEQCPQAMDLLLVNHGEMPLLVRYLQHGRVHIETVCVLGMLLEFFPMWNRKVRDTILWPATYRSLIKFCAFVPFDHDAMGQFIHKIIHEQKQLTNTA